MHVYWQIVFEKFESVEDVMWFYYLLTCYFDLLKFGIKCMRMKSYLKFLILFSFPSSQHHMRQLLQNFNVSMERMQLWGQSRNKDTDSSRVIR